MPDGNIRVVQRRGVPQAEAVAERFGNESLGAPVEVLPGIIPVAKVTRVDIPMMGTTTVAALAANRSQIQLFNPAGSNTWLILKRMWVGTGGGTTLNLKTHDTALTTLASTIASMLRQEGSSQVAPVGQVRQVQGAAVGSQIGLAAIQANITEFFDFFTDDGEEFNGLVIQPGRGILVSPNADNVEMKAMFQWSERQVA